MQQPLKNQAVTQAPTPFDDQKYLFFLVSGANYNQTKAKAKRNRAKA
jgi:hypothetical protein